MVQQIQYTVQSLSANGRYDKCPSARVQEQYEKNDNVIVTCIDPFGMKKTLSYFSTIFISSLFNFI